MRHPVVAEDLAEISSRKLPWEKLDGKTILVSGAYGFIPAYLVEALLYQNETRRAGIRVLALGRNPEKARRRFAHYQNREDLVYLFQDVCEQVQIEEPIDYLIHAASWASPKYYGKQPVEVIAPNALGTELMLRLAHARKVSSFLFFSSAEIYGAPPPDRIPVKEDYVGNVSPTDVRSCYAESKRLGETLCASWWHEYGVPAKIARIFHTYGPGMDLEDGRVFADFVRDVVQGRDLHMKSDGSAVRAYCYLADAVDGLLRILLQGEPANPYNMGNDQAECSVLELAETLISAFPERGIKLVRDVETRTGYLKSTVSRTCPNTARLRALGWETRYPVREGFVRTIRSYLGGT